MFQGDGEKHKKNSSMKFCRVKVKNSSKAFVVTKEPQEELKIVQR